MKNNIKKFSVIALIALNVFVAGAVFGGLKGYEYAKGQASTTNHAVQEALKSTVASK